MNGSYNKDPVYGYNYCTFVLRLGSCKTFAQAAMDCFNFSEAGTQHAFNYIPYAYSTTYDELKVKLCNTIICLDIFIFLELTLLMT